MKVIGKYLRLKIKRKIRLKIINSIPVSLEKSENIKSGITYRSDFFDFMFETACTAKIPKKKNNVSCIAEIYRADSLLIGCNKKTSDSKNEYVFLKKRLKNKNKMQVFKICRKT